MSIRWKQRDPGGRHEIRWSAPAITFALVLVTSPGCQLLAGLTGGAPSVCQSGDDCHGSVATECSGFLPGECGAGQVCSKGACQDVVKISAGGATTCAQLSDGRVWCWGLNSYGQSGQLLVHSTPANGGEIEIAFPESRLTPRPLPVPGLEDVEDIAVGGDAESGHACARTRSGEVWCWGDNGSLQVDASQPAPLAMPRQVKSGLEDLVIERVYAGFGRTCATTSALDEGSANLWCWGGKMDDEDEPYPSENVTFPDAVSGRRPPTQIQGVRQVTGVALGRSHTCVLAKGQKVHCWGNGDGTSPFCGHQLLTEIPLGSPATSVTAGDDHMCAATAAGVYCWGANSFGQAGGSGDACAGKGPAEPCCVPPTLVLPAGDDPAMGQYQHRVAAGGQHTCASWPSGDVTCWGRIADGQAASTPPGELDPADLALGSHHACARLAAGGVECWGYNELGQLGLGNPDTEYYEEPESVKWYQSDEPPPPL